LHRSAREEPCHVVIAIIIIVILVTTPHTYRHKQHGQQFCFFSPCEEREEEEEKAEKENLHLSGNSFHNEGVGGQRARFIEAANVYLAGKGNSKRFRAEHPFARKKKKGVREKKTKEETRGLFHRYLIYGEPRASCSLQERAPWAVQEEPPK
jgi:hypothetical protein